jgi:protein-tyrosine phosphatase
MAALVFDAHVERAGLGDVVRVSSGGIGTWHAGEPADPRAQAVLSGHGYPTGHVASEVDEDRLGADLLLAAGDEHVQYLLEKGVDPAKVRLLRSFDPAAEEGAEIEDPYSGEPEGYEELLATIELAMPELVRWSRQQTDSTIT